jgi:hypothetical protein
MIKFLPDEIIHAKQICKSCGQEYNVPIKKDFPNSLAPVIPKDFHPKTNNKFWQLQSLEIPCPLCGERTMCELPTRKKKAKVLLYGDDASREVNDDYVYCYSLVGGSHPFVMEASENLRSLKMSYSPNDWTLHMKDIVSGNQRSKHSIFKEWHKEKVDQLICDLFTLLERSSNDLFIFNVSFSSRNSLPDEDLKRDCYISLIADLIYGFTQSGFTPVLHFDSEKEFKGIEPVIHGWARDAFLGPQRSLLYSFLSHGLPVPEPVFVKPASHPCLELADFVSYIIARNHYCHLNKLVCEYPTEKLGKVFYSWLRRDHNYGRDRRVGFPWNEIYD